MSADCVFCKIVAGSIPARIVLDTEHCLAFLDVAPLAVGHTLLIPKHHFVTLDETPAEITQQLGAVLPRLSRAVLRGSGSEGYNLLQNNGGVAGQVVRHVHFHLIPRRQEDGLGYRWHPLQEDKMRDEAAAEHIRLAMVQG